MAHEINTALFYWSVKQQLPMAHTADVNVHEVRAAIVPHSSAMQAQGCVTQLRRRDPKVGECRSLRPPYASCAAHTPVCGLRVRRNSLLQGPSIAVCPDYG